MELALAGFAFNMLEALLPKIQQQFQKGQITPEQQKEVLDQYNSLKAKADGQFSGPEWQIV